MIPDMPLPAHCTFETFADSAALANRLADTIAAILRADIAQKGEATLAVSGGKTPVKFFATLSKHIMDWGRVTITLVDERFVAPNSDRSNARLVREYLLQNLAAGAKFIPALAQDDQNTTPEAALPAWRAALETIKSPFTVTVLGMGADGHTASFFPGSRGLDAALDMANPAGAVAIYASQMPEPRLTLTLPKILASRQIFLHFEGADKRKTYEAALKPGDSNTLPIRAILHRPDSLAPKVPVRALWCP